MRCHEFTLNTLFVFFHVICFSCFSVFFCVSACLQVGCQRSLSCSSDELVMVWLSIHNESLWIQRLVPVISSDLTLSNSASASKLWVYYRLPTVLSQFSPPCACGSVVLYLCAICHRLGVPVSSAVYRPRMRTLILGNSQDDIPNAPTQAAQLHCTTIGPCSEPCSELKDGDVEEVWKST